MKNSLLAISLVSVSLPTWSAIDLTDNLSVSGFGSTSWASSQNETALLVNRNINDDNCFDCDTTFGLQFDYYYNAFNASLQLVKRPQDHWSEPQVEWAYLSAAYDDFEFRVGRLRLPVFLASEYYYVGHAYTSARPNEEVYNSILGVTAYNGASIIWNHSLSDEMQLSLTPYVGFKDNNDVELNKVVSLEFETEFMWGVNALLTGDNYRINFTYLDSTYDQKVKVNNQQIASSDDEEISLYSLGAEYEIGQLKLTAEGQYNDLTKSWYTGAAYRMGKFTPYTQFGQKYARSTSTSIYDGKTGESWLLGVRYDVMYSVSINAEWQTFSAFGGQSGPFVETPVDSDADMFTVMVNFVF
ncbi:sulfate ABC transporter permease [Vibrio hippocampi]|uniref:Sulfate ABC transporter permease n=1 Tax=Vibrio hippocampi TaxID=654686 RepID=A0ABM8ZKM8_9VIBR|nr:sulfate ABC transporter permease [Vibrio hippocampi]CAH0528680.1 hypothetical protein VHP8226_02705 [Vibrio hippocampi]